MRVLPLLALFACGQDAGRCAAAEAEPGAPPAYILTASTPSGAAPSRRIDGIIARSFPLVVPGTDFSQAVITSRHAGEDACQVLFYDDRNELRRRYRPPTITPWPAQPGSRRNVDGLRRARTWPHPDGLLIHPIRGEHVISVVAIASTSPSNLVLLTPKDGDLERRFVFWNLGHIAGVQFEESWLVAWGYANSFRSKTWGMEWYSPFVAVFALDDILADGTAHAECPVFELGDGGGYHRYVVGSPDRKHSFEFESVSVRGDTLVATTASGLEYHIDLVSRRVGIESTSRYKRELPQRRIPGDPGVEEHLSELRKDIRIYPR